MRRHQHCEVHAVEGEWIVGIYAGPIGRALSWARRANPNATLKVAAISTPQAQEKGEVGRG